MTELLAAVAALLGASAAWVGILSPRARRQRKARDEAIAKQLEFHSDWTGNPERRGAAGELIAAAVPGVMERLATLEGKLQAPILNGRGNRLLDTVDRLDGAVKRLDGRQVRFAGRLTQIDQRIEARFTEQIVTMAETLSVDPPAPTQRRGR